MSAQHTPGPWADRGFGDVHAPGRPVAAMRQNGEEPHRRYKSQMVSVHDAEDLANARLIAAAPDLLEALILLEAEKADYMRLNHLGDPAEQHTNRLARAAISKATADA